MAGRAHVLVVENEPLILEALRALFERRGLRVSAVANGADAIRLLSVQAVDAIVTDLNMPRCGGAELIAEIRRRDGHALPVIVLTADDQAAQEVASWDNVQVLRKPAGIVEIMAAIGRALA